MKTKKWTHSRHKRWRNFTCAVLRPYCKSKYNLHVDRFKKQGKRQYLVLLNHQTPFDQFFVNMAFKGAMYFVCTEDMFSNGNLSKFIRHAIAPIPFKKSRNDVGAVLNCRKVVKEGGSVALMPEGNRTYSGATCNINDAVAKLVKVLGLPVAFFRIEGGYGTFPRWSDKPRKGKIHAYVSRVLEKDEYQQMSDDELYRLIKTELYVNEACADGVKYKSRRRAEYIERALYVCPDCGLTQFYSKGNFFHCEKCGKKIEYCQDKTLRGVGFDLPFKYVYDWYCYQEKFVNSLDVSQYFDKPVSSEWSDLYEVCATDKKKIATKVNVTLFGNRVEFELKKGKVTLDFDKTVTSMACMGRNKLNIYTTEKTYQLKGNARFSALKYMNLFFRYKNYVGESDDGFLGI